MNHPPFIHSFRHPHTLRTKFPPSGPSPCFDFIIVGGGPAGCALATRLAERTGGRFSVLLVEQGPSVEEHPELRNCVNHVMQTRALHGGLFDAAYPAETTDQFCQEALTINSGRVLGGSTCINWAIWTRGPKEDYDLWAELSDNPRFKWENVTPLFASIESRISTRPVSASPRPHFWSSTARLSLEQSKFTYISDINSGSVPGNGYAQMVECLDEEGNRANATRYVYAYEDKGVKGLEVWTSLKVLALEVGCNGGERSGNVITGVKTEHGPIKARYEVILTASSIQNTVLLHLSGIGPAAELAKHSIPTVKDLPVGCNLWDHPFVDVQLKMKENKRRDTTEDFASLRTSARHADQWAKTKTGLLSGLPYEWMAFTNLRELVANALAADGTLSMADRRVLLQRDTPHIEQFLHYGHGLRPAPDALSASYIAISSVLLTPHSRGYVTLREGDRDGKQPMIVLNEMKDKLDREMMVTALEKAYTILRSEAWKEILDTESDMEMVPRRAELLEIIKRGVSTLWHLGGTCAMQTKDAEGVVDNMFRVHGVDGLRVADISVLPFPVVAHTQAVAYVIGEKAAELIGEQYQDVIE